MAPRSAKAASTAGVKNQTLVIDNGAFTIKAGVVASSPTIEDCKVIPNCIAKDSVKKVWVGSQLDQCKDFGEMAFRRPVEKGYLVNWEAERAIWGHSFLAENAVAKCDPHETNLLLTEAPNCPQALQTNTDQIIFEEFEYASYCRTLAPTLNAYNDIPSLFGGPSSGDSSQGPAECLLVVDSGYSHTTVTPLINGHPVQQAIRRLDIGGKFLTNYLKEQLSIRAFYAMDETWIVNEIKEATSFVSDNFSRDLERTWKGGKTDRRSMDPSLLVDYVLPDFESTFRGVVRPYDHTTPKMNSRAPVTSASRDKIVTLGNERFAAPELLFNPSDVGMKEAGLPAVIIESVNALPLGLRPSMFANTIVVGGNALIPGFLERLRREVRELTPSEYDVRIASPEDPIRSTWLGGARLAAQHQNLANILVTRKEYLEHGASWLLRRFATHGP
ncbi:Actin/actin-like protein [Trichodelitschia bisporula]|uniref:Actin-like protein ARP6 n=1 Tax=Trichodelitschia bisporula TaxID=703511 RepID=A0A6G1HRC1_9PEZI|nr:Actin/actin-like protein [Trichodelitschia bisporula]